MAFIKKIIFATISKLIIFYLDIFIICTIRLNRCNVVDLIGRTGLISMRIKEISISHNDNSF